MLHTGEATCAKLKNVIKSWELILSVRAVTTENASEMISAMRKIKLKLRTLVPSFYQTDDSLHFHRFEHVVYLAVRECIKVLYGMIFKIRLLLHAMRASLRRRDLLERRELEPSVVCKLSNLESVTH